MKKTKRMIIGIALAFALIAPVVEPEIVANTTTVVQAKDQIKYWGGKKLNKIAAKIKVGQKKKKVKKILGLKLGKPTRVETGKYKIEEYVVKIYVSKTPFEDTNIIRICYFRLSFSDGKLEDYERTYETIREDKMGEQ